MPLHIFVTGACAAGKSTLARALSSQLQLPLHRLDSDPEFRQLVPLAPDLNRLTDPKLFARWQALRPGLVWGVQLYIRCGQGAHGVSIEPANDPQLRSNGKLLRRGAGKVVRSKLRRIRR